VNLIGDHTDYNQGLALPMALDLGLTVTYTETRADDLTVYSALSPEPAVVPVDQAFDRRAVADLSPDWARLVGAVVAQCAPAHGGVVRITGDLPAGAGLSSSAALCVGLALALGVEAPPDLLARLGQRAEAMTGAEVGTMDFLTCAVGRAGHALLLDFAEGGPGPEPVALPGTAEVVVVHSGVSRTIAGSPYAARRAECEAAALALHTPLGLAEEADLPGLADPVLRRRTRHVVTECARVRAAARALAEGDPAAAGALMTESHHSLARDFEVSLPALDRLVEDLTGRPGVHGARLTGGGFGGCVVALTEPGAVETAEWPGRAWVVQAADGAAVSVSGAPVGVADHPPL
jgi:galactokinase